MSTPKEDPHRWQSRFWRSTWVTWWIQGHGSAGYSFRLLLVPLIGSFALVFVPPLDEIGDGQGGGRPGPS